ncbi:MAG: PQQ-dependent dehydrogenase, methanol/ethanol family [Alphaproteobacteria bacterium]|nr:PQQ-dependent dehydrogenase, methanol/ethanol family [Alphaproteobacteria bacterium]MBV9371664.1 PQQ-dependent dehydrogenase, methanol/ethanol family [Alphaproteobacteria bacterium]MBV9900860.1 PQQ-dependent dehydrogenase, methanol/ethanol family [Alphaproteobacteria bacterium]
MRHACLRILRKPSIAAFMLLCSAFAAPLAAQHNGARPAAAASPPEDGQWTMPSRDYASTRYSGLNQITRSNVRNLKLAFTFDTLNRKGHEAAPIVVGNMMYLTTPYPNHVWALDLSKGGRAVWVFRPHPAPASQGIACCDVVNRGAMYANGRLFFTTLDGEVFAIDAKSGHQVWRNKIGDISKGETITMSPLVAEGKVLVGNSGGEMGVRGWLAALDAGTGRLAWKAYSTGPDKDVLIGPSFKPYYASDRGADLGVHTWPAEAWKIGGGTVWGWISYDPQLKMIYYGTGNPGPWNAQQRPGDNKWTTGVFARDIATGQARWFYQSSPHDLFDHDDINEQVLLDMPIHGRMTPVLVRPGRNGYMYVIDRRTGQVYSAEAYGFINSMDGVDLATGRVRMVKEKAPKEGRVIRNICPTASGVKDWNPSAFSPRTGLLYVPHENMCMDEGVFEANYIAGTPYVGADVKMYAGPGGHRGVFTAWDPVRAKPVWEIKESLPLWSGALATGGDVVFYGTMDGWFKAIDASAAGGGRLLWQVRLDSGIISQPVSYRGPDGRQYVAVVTGVGGWAGAIVSAQLDPRDPTAALGMVNAMRDLPGRTKPGGTLYVFALPK